MDDTNDPEIPSYLRLAILTTVFCCLPLGILSIVYAAQVSVKREVGDFAGARIASERARKYAWLSFWLGIASYVFFAIAIALSAAFLYFYSAGQKP
jgi:hypothetical protein